MDAVETIRRPGCTQKNPEKLHADKGYDFLRCRDASPARGGPKREARSPPVGGRAHAGLTVPLPEVLTALQVEIHEAFLHLGCSIICLDCLS